MTLPYQIKFVIINSRKIYNYIGPWDWRDGLERINKRQYIYDRALNWYNDLEHDILSNGVKNPISVVSGFLAKNDFRSLPEFARKEYLICNIHGGSRLFVCQKHNLDIPCIVSDFNNRFKNAPNLYDVKEIFSLFENKPERIIYSKYGLDLRTMPEAKDK